MILLSKIRWINFKPNFLNHLISPTNNNLKPMEAQQHFKLIDAYRKKIQEYSENDYSSNFDMFFLQEIYPKFTFISCSQFLQIARHLCKVFMINNFEIAIIKLNPQHLNDSGFSFSESKIIDPLLEGLLIEFKNHPEFSERMVSLVMIFLNAKVY